MGESPVKPKTLNETLVSSPDVGKKFITIGGVQCVVENDNYYERVREYFGFSDSFVDNTFNFADLKEGSGKGGDPLCQTSDELFYIKQLNTGDHNVLITPKFAKALCHHVIKPPSVLGPILAHFLNPDTGNHYIAMLNCLRYNGEWRKMYDLKGCADDRLIINEGEKVAVVRKRFYKLHIWAGLGGRKRRVYKQGKLEALHNPFIPINQNDKELVMEAIKRDTEFLTRHRLMDYSLIVGVADLDNNVAKDLVEEVQVYAGKPLITREEEGETGTVLYVGIIDYLQRWNGAKIAAKLIKVLERNKSTVPPVAYGHRFAAHFDFVLISVDLDQEEQREKRDRRRHPHRCFPCIRA